MSLLELFGKLTHLLDIKGDVLKNLLNVKITNAPTTINNNQTYNIDNRTLIIYHQNLPLESQQEFKTILKEAEQQGELLFNNEQSKILEDAVSYHDQHSEDDQLLLKFFKDLIPKQDYRALEEALFLRYEFRFKKKNIDALKHEIRLRYGPRGNNIANLCSADYFDDLRGIYNEYGEAFFKKVYDLMVGKEAYTLFVSKEMSVQEATQKIENALKQAKRYGVDIYQIHGMGKKNIQKVEEAIKKLLKDGETKFVSKNVYQEKNPEIIIVELLL